MINRKYQWNAHMVHYTKYTTQQLQSCFKDMCILFTGIEKCSLQTVRKKYMLDRFLKVALIKMQLRKCDEQVVFTVSGKEISK